MQGVRQNWDLMGFHWGYKRVWGKLRKSGVGSAGVL